jgi:hypothetical protein
MPNCDAIEFLTYEGTLLRKFPASTAYFYTTQRMEIDADGAPNAYHPEDRGIDALANAGFPHGGWRDILAIDPLDSTRPFVQRAGPFAGFFVSKTRLEDSTREVTDPARYVDSTAVPYLVFPGSFHALTGWNLRRLRDGAKPEQRHGHRGDCGRRRSEERGPGRGVDPAR